MDLSKYIKCPEKPTTWATLNPDNADELKAKLRLLGFKFNQYNEIYFPKGTNPELCNHNRVVWTSATTSETFCRQFALQRYLENI